MELEIKNLSTAKKVLNTFIDKVKIDYNHLDNSLKKIKNHFIEKLDEENAKQAWILQTLSLIQQTYLKSFELLKEKKYYPAWCELEKCEIEITLLSNYYKIEKDPCIVFIDEYTKKYQSLFPYKLFSSYEMVYEEVECSICHKKITPKNFCGHKKGDIYLGESCSRIVTKASILAVSVVKNPVHKYAVIFPGGMEKDIYRYHLLDTLIPRLNDAYHRWNLELTKKSHPIEKFSHVGRNDKCPCGSDKKFKLCCYKKAEIETDHHLFTFIDLLHKRCKSDEILTF